MGADRLTRLPWLDSFFTAPGKFDSPAPPQPDDRMTEGGRGGRTAPLGRGMQGLRAPPDHHQGAFPQIPASMMARARIGTVCPFSPAMFSRESPTM